MKRCCECKKIVWPWQQSKISASPIHLKCHQPIIANLMRDPEMAAMARKEIRDFEKATRTNTGLST
jgi:hypothetical protein